MSSGKQGDIEIDNLNDSNSIISEEDSAFDFSPNGRRSSKRET
jgi:hypothetical protein